jgi:hypothetical protein
MKHFQVLLLALVTMITFELGLLMIKFPTPAARAGPSTADPRISADPTPLD